MSGGRIHCYLLGHQFLCTCVILSSSWWVLFLVEHQESAVPLFHLEQRYKELDRIKQVLMNNGFKNTEITNAIKDAIDKYHAPTNTTSDAKETIKLFYKNHMSSQYKDKNFAILHDLEQLVQHPTCIPDHLRDTGNIPDFS